MTIAPFFVVVGLLSVGSSNVFLILLFLGVSAFGVGLWTGNLHVLAVDSFASANLGGLYGFAGSAGALGGVFYNVLVTHLRAQGSDLGMFLTLSLLQPLGALSLWLLVRSPLQPDIHMQAIEATS
jgi:nitrate/nitrite transporter NarK